MKTGALKTGTQGSPLFRASQAKVRMLAARQLIHASPSPHTLFPWWPRTPSFGLLSHSFWQPFPCRARSCKTNSEADGIATPSCLVSRDMAHRHHVYIYDTVSFPFCPQSFHPTTAPVPLTSATSPVSQSSFIYWIVPGHKGICHRC